MKFYWIKNFISEHRTKLKQIPRILINTVNEFIDDKALKMGAALSYYTLISLAPIIIIVIALVGFIYGEDAAKGQIVSQFQDHIGTYAAETVQSLILSASAPGTGLMATIIGVLVLLFTSAAVFVELKESLNIIWGVEPIPGKGIKNLLLYRLKSFILVLVFGVLLFLTIFLSTVSVLIKNLTAKYFPEFVPYLTYINVFTSIVMITLLFACILKYLPDVKVKWKYVWFGAIVTSGLFYIGKYLISIYLQHATLSSTYGAAGSLVVFLVWINYSSLILFLGAELTQVIRNTFGSTPVEPKPGFILITKITTLVSNEVDAQNAANIKDEKNNKSI